MSDAEGGSPRSSRTIVLIKVDTLGDLVVFAGALRALREREPAARVIGFIRQSYVSLAPLLAPNIDWRTTTLQPFAVGPEGDPAELERLREEIRALAADVLIAATSRRNWLETALAAASPAAMRVCFAGDATDAFFETQLRLHGIDTASAFTDVVPFDAQEPDWQRGYRLVEHVTGAALTRGLPEIDIPPAAVEAAGAWLSAEGFAAEPYLVCAAAGFANVALKTWSADRFANVLDHVQRRHGLRILLVGHESEGDYLRGLAVRLEKPAPVWLGGDGALPNLAAVIARASVYLGNDTGAMHLAAAAGVPVVAIFGGGTWPRFVPAAKRGIAVVHPLPCFGCGWDCAFGDAPCLGEIHADDVIAAVEAVLSDASPAGVEVRALRHLPDHTLVIMDKAATQYRQARSDHLARQHKLEELTALDREKDDAIHEKEAEIDEKEVALFAAEASMKEKDASIHDKEREIHTKQAEIDALRKVCAEREELIIALDRNCRALETRATTIAADKALLEKTLAELPADRAHAVETIAGQAIHIRNLEAVVHLRTQELTELQKTTANLLAGCGDLEQAKRFHKLLAEKEAVIRDLSRSCAQREAVIRQLMAETTKVGSGLWKLSTAVGAYTREKVVRPFSSWAEKRYIETHWMQIGILRQYAPKPLRWDRLPAARSGDGPRIAIVTPSYGQERFIERTLRSVLDQSYANRLYVVQDGGSKDRSAEIIARYAPKLRHWESVKDAGQADAIHRGFGRVVAELGRDDLMAWLNSDDLFGPGTLAYVAEYFRRHPEVDVVYGHRIIIDDEDRDIGRWIMPPHDPRTLEWIDYVPQETLFWRKRAWDAAGGIDPTFQFALDWDLLARFQQSGCRIVRLPYFLGAFRVHAEQKTTQVIHTVGADEMRRIRTRFHGERQDDPQTIDRLVRDTRRRGVLAARLLALGIRR